MLEFKKVSVSVSKTPILSEISASFEKGRITSIVGPNGCGKTTLLQTLNGISTVTDGKIWLDGEDYLKLPQRERAKILSFLPQFHDSAPNISVKGLVEHGRFPYMGFSRKMSSEDRRAVDEALEFTGLSEYRECLVGELSGGLQQRAYLAMQLAQDSQYMVLDEPMNYLDFPGQREMGRLIGELAKRGKTIILVLHDLNQALRLSDYMVVMGNRKIIGEGTPSECLDKGIIARVFDCEINSIEINGGKQYVFW